MQTDRAAEDPPGLATLDLDELRDHRQRLIDKEQIVSYWRRVVQARLDLLDVPRDEQEHVAVPDLIQTLSGSVEARRRPALLRTLPEQPMMILAEVGDVWMRPLHLGDPEDIVAVRRASADAETGLSARRKHLLTRLDAATAELVRRYTTDPEAALELLPNT